MGFTLYQHYKLLSNRFARLSFLANAVGICALLVHQYVLQVLQIERDCKL